MGPWEVLSSWTQSLPEDAVTVSTYSPGGSAVRCAKGMRILPDRAIGDPPRMDVFLHPGGGGTRELLRDPDHLALMRALAADTEVMTSVCTGSLVYAAAGLLNGRPATTHLSVPTGQGRYAVTSSTTPSLPPESRSFPDAPAPPPALESALRRLRKLQLSGSSSRPR